MIAAARARLRAAPPAPTGASWTPGDALHDAGRVLEVMAGVALVTFAVALPLAVIGGAAWAAIRFGARRRRERLLDMA